MTTSSESAPVLADLPVDARGLPTLVGSPWARLIVDQDSAPAVALCGWDRDGAFHLWGEPEKIAEAVFKAAGAPIRAAYREPLDLEPPEHDYQDQPRRRLPWGR